MAFAYGTTRFVICVGPFAIKVARVKFLYWLGRFFHWRKNGGVLVKLASTSTTKRASALRHLFAGVTANLEEWRLSRQHARCIPIAPTILTLGFVNIQVRGLPLVEDELALCPFREIARGEPPDIDLNKIENFGRIGREIYLIDYGFEELNVKLATYAETRQLAYNFNW